MRLRFEILPNAACQNIDPQMFDAVSWPAAERGLKYCGSCPVRVDCLRVIDPFRSYYDGIAGGYVWKDGGLLPWSVRETETAESYFAGLPTKRPLPQIESADQETIEW